MSFLPFREHHLLQILDSMEDTHQPLDRQLYHYFRSNKALGSKDRKFVADTLYGLVRWKGTLNRLLPKTSWDKKLAFFQENDLSEAAKDLPPHQQLSLPKFFFATLVEQYGLEKATDLARAFNEPAPTFLRANRLKTTREALLERWEGTVAGTPCLHAPNGICLEKRIPVFSLPEFQEGLFEMQDEGSQCLAQLVDAKPGEQVLDYCSGSGGKTLAFAPAMEGKGQIYLHDIRLPILQEAKRRLKRAGIQNAQILPPEKIGEKRWKGSMDWVLVDAPCSGTGTLRRNPDMKWKLSPEMINSLVGEQRTIFERALRFVRPGGKIVYATCSILSRENEAQTAHFLENYPLTLCNEWSSLPKSGEMDGFYGAVFEKH